MYPADRKVDLNLWISLGDFIAHIATANGTGDGRQGAAVATTDLIAQQSADHSAYADANWTIVCNRCRLLVHGCWRILPDRLCLCKLGRPCMAWRSSMLDILVMYDCFVLNHFLDHGWRNCDLLCRYGCNSSSLRCNARCFCSSAMRIREYACNRRNAQQADQHHGHCSAGHQGVDAVRGLIHFHVKLR